MATPEEAWQEGIEDVNVDPGENPYKGSPLEVWWSRGRKCEEMCIAELGRAVRATLLEEMIYSGDIDIEPLFSPGDLWRSVNKNPDHRDARCFMEHFPEDSFKLTATMFHMVDLGLLKFEGREEGRDPLLHDDYRPFVFSITRPIETKKTIYPPGMEPRRRRRREDRTTKSK